MVAVGRICTVVLMVLAIVVALNFNNSKQMFGILVLVGAGTGLIYILRWFWWRINVWSEVTAMIASFLVAFTFYAIGKGWIDAGLEPGHWLGQSHWQLCIGILITTCCWVSVTLLTPPVDVETLKGFVRKTRPGGPGWRHVEDRIAAEGGHRVEARLALKVLCVFPGTFSIWGSLFGIGGFLYGKPIYGVALLAVAAVSMFLIFRVWDKISGSDR